MKKYRVYLTASAAMSASVYVEAESEEEARKAAIRQAEEGRVDWDHDGVDDSTIEFEQLTEILPRYKRGKPVRKPPCLLVDQDGYHPNPMKVPDSYTRAPDNTSDEGFGVYICQKCGEGIDFQ